MPEVSRSTKVTVDPDAATLTPWSAVREVRITRLRRERKSRCGHDILCRDGRAVGPLEVGTEHQRVREATGADRPGGGEVPGGIPAAVELEQRAIQQMSHIHHRRIGCVDERVERHRTLGDDQSLGELRAADQPEMQREGEPERPDRTQHQCGAGDDLNRPVPGEPPYLVT